MRGNDDKQRSHSHERVSHTHGHNGIEHTHEPMFGPGEFRAARTHLR